MINYVELLALCNRQAKRIEELECINSELEKFYFEVAKELLEKDSILSEVQEHINHLMKDYIIYTKNKFEAHNLEQQAKGFENAIDVAIDLGFIENDVHVCDSIRKQAAKLKEVQMNE